MNGGLNVNQSNHLLMISRFFLFLTTLFMETKSYRFLFIARIIHAYHYEKQFSTSNNYLIHKERKMNFFLVISSTTNIDRIHVNFVEN